jgi:hypothetical protein
VSKDAARSLGPKVPILSRKNWRAHERRMARIRFVAEAARTWRGLVRREFSGLSL